MKALVVEDYKPLRSSVSKAIREMGWAVDAAADGAEGRAQGLAVERSDWICGPRDNVPVMLLVARCSKRNTGKILEQDRHA